MAQTGRRTELVRYGAAAAFLAAVTIAALLIRSGIKGADVATTTTSTKKHAVKPAYVPPASRRYYRVHAGDTLAAIAFRFRTSLYLLKQLNRHLQPNSLQVGQRIRVK